VGSWTKTPAARAFAVKLAAYGAQARQRSRWDTTTAHVEVRIRVVFDSERPDTDSPVKAILDSLEVSRPKLNRPGAGFLANDRQVRRYTVDRAVDKLRPRVEVEVLQLVDASAWEEAHEPIVTHPGQDPVAAGHSTREAPRHP
jgi:Holliday junction resolvase RusA-like endonuclease